MDIESFREYCLRKKGVTEEFPFGEEVLVFKVGGKMFAATSLTFKPFRVNLKCDPELAIELREQYNSVEPGFHMNKKHWNSIYFESGEITNNDLVEMIDHSYDLVVSSLSKKLRSELHL